MTDAELIKETVRFLAMALKQQIDLEALVVELTGLYEDNGHPIIGSVGYPAND